MHPKQWTPWTILSGLALTTFLAVGQRLARKAERFWQRFLLKERLIQGLHQHFCRTHCHRITHRYDSLHSRLDQSVAQARLHLSTEFARLAGI